MADSNRILNRSFGSLDADLMFVGEAPGRLGADASGIPFHGDRAGQNFEALIDQVGISRYAVYVTNAVMCNPRDSEGRNSTPSKAEVKNCSSFLLRQIKLIEPKIIVTLGGTALEAIKAIQHHDYTLSANVRTANQWYDRLLIPCYHPGQRAMAKRNFSNQLADFQFVAENLRRLPKPSRKPSKTLTPEVVAEVVRNILNFTDSLSYFALHKIFYLIEYYSFVEFGERITDSYIIRQKDGPYSVDLQLDKLKKSIKELGVKSDRGHLELYLQQNTEMFPEVGQIELSPQKQELIKTTVEKYQNESDARLKTIVYLTSPMRKILLKERKLRENMFNTPVLFQ